MRIAIDFDGVILDSEAHIKFWADYFSYFEINKPRIKTDEVTQDICFEWTNDEMNNFYTTYFQTATNNYGFVVVAKEMLEKLKAEGQKLIIVSKSGFYNQDELKFALPKLDEFGFEFDNVLFGVKNKVDTCKELDIDLMIEDNPENVEQFFNSNIKVIYLRAKNIRKINHKNVTEVSDWFEIYKTIHEMK